MIKLVNPLVVFSPILKYNLAINPIFPIRMVLPPVKGDRTVGSTVSINGAATPQLNQEPVPAHPGPLCERHDPLRAE